MPKKSEVPRICYSCSKQMECTVCVFHLGFESSTNAIKGLTF